MVSTIIHNNIKNRAEQRAFINGLRDASKRLQDQYAKGAQRRLLDQLARAIERQIIELDKALAAS